MSQEMKGRRNNDAASGIRELSPEDENEIFEQAAQAYLGLSGTEFLQKYRQGLFDEMADDSRLVRVVMLIPSGR